MKNREVDLSLLAAVAVLAGGCSSASSGGPVAESKEQKLKLINMAPLPRGEKQRLVQKIEQGQPLKR